MPTLSPLASLAAILATICQQAQQHQQLFGKNEAATRAALIEPVLRALGWDTADVTMVEPEKMIDTAWRADYALLSKSGKIEMLIEAKCLGSNLEKYSAVKQLLGYAFGFGVIRIIITDGINWHFYNDFKPADAQIEGHFNLLQEPHADCALQLIKWLDAMRFGHQLIDTVLTASDTPTATTHEFYQKSKNHQIAIKSNSKDIANKLLSTTPKASTKKGHTAKLAIGLAQLNAKNYIPLTPALALNAHSKPTWIQLPDGIEYPLKNWKDILIQASKLLLHVCPHLILPVPDKVGKKVLLISRKKPNPDRSFITVTHQKEPLIFTLIIVPQLALVTLYIY